MKKGLIIVATTALILGVGMVAEAAGAVSEARLPLGESEAYGRTVSVKAYDRVGVYGKSNGGAGAQNVSYEIKDENNRKFVGGTIYVGTDVNYFPPNAVSTVKSTIYKSDGKHNGAVVRAQGI
ncbi:MAG: hypothetical protein ACRC6T_10440 [Sarcina sp.]